MTIDTEHRTSGHQAELFPLTPASPTRDVERSRVQPWRRVASVVGALAVLAIGLLLGLLLAANSSSGSPTITGEQAAPPRITPGGGVASAAQAVAPSVVQIETSSGLGSGVIYRSDGLILTAAHVIDGAENVDVRLADGRLLNGRVIGTHTPTDVGVISIDAPGLIAATLGYGTGAQVGETAVAVGSPFGLNQTVTAGIVSAVGRNVNGIPMVQTDAAINPGNSGGPLVNASGHVIGINDVIFSEGGGNDGIGFAIAIDVAIVVADQLVEGGTVELAALGTATVPDTSGAGGAIVREVVPGSPAATARLLVGDRIISVDGTVILDPGDLFAAVIAHRPGSVIEIEFTRDGQPITVQTTLAGIET